MDDFEGVFEKKICRFIWAKCRIKQNDTIYRVHFSGTTFGSAQNEYRSAQNGYRSAQAKLVPEKWTLIYIWHHLKFTDILPPRTVKK